MNRVSNKDMSYNAFHLLADTWQFSILVDIYENTGDANIWQQTFMLGQIEHHIQYFILYDSMHNLEMQTVYLDAGYIIGNNIMQ